MITMLLHYHKNKPCKNFPPTWSTFSLSHPALSKGQSPPKESPFYIYIKLSETLQQHKNMSVRLSTARFLSVKLLCLKFGSFSYTHTHTASHPNNFDKNTL